MEYAIILCVVEPEPDYNIRVVSPKGRTYMVSERAARALLGRGWSIVLDEPIVTDEIPH